MTAEHISRQFISQVTGSRTLGLLAGEVAYTDRRAPSDSFFGECKMQHVLQGANGQPHWVWLAVFPSDRACGIFERKGR